MPKLEASTIEKYQMILQKDPHSQVFAPLAEAYRELKMLSEAEKVAREGVKQHPHFASGLVVLAKIYRDQKKPQESLKLLQKAVSLAQENILAHHLMAEAYLALKEPKEALKAFKMVLFLNPKSESAKKAIQKLESLTADEYDDELFEMTKLQDWMAEAPTENKSPFPADALKKTADSDNLTKGLERMLSLIDAFIVRNDLEKAQILLQDCQSQYGFHEEVLRRIKTLNIRSGKDFDEEVAEPLIPLSSRDPARREKKIESLNMMLRNIEHYRSQY